MSQDRMSIRERIAIAINGAANMLEDFPANAARGAKAWRGAVVDHARRVAYSVAPRCALTKPAPMYDGKGKLIGWVEVPANAEVFHSAGGYPCWVGPTPPN